MLKLTRRIDEAALLTSGDNAHQIYLDIKLADPADA